MSERHNRNEIRQSYLRMTQSRRVRTADAAQILGISELDLLDTFPEYVLALNPDFRRIFLTLEQLGCLRGLTRNEHAVIECEGEYRPFAHSEQAALVVGEGIDLRLFLKHFAFARLVMAPNCLKLPEGVVFFNAWGRALHKVFFTAGTIKRARERIWEELGAPDGEYVQLAYPSDHERRDSAGNPIEDFDPGELRKAWAGMRDTHDVFSLLRRFGITRLRALSALGTEWALPALPDALWRLLQEVAATGLPIMVFVGNAAVTQIYKGPIQKIALAGDWWNVLDPRFNLHVQHRAVGQSWIVRKPVPEGIVTSLEVFSRNGELVTQIFSYRQPCTAESEEWRAALARLVIS